MDSGSGSSSRLNLRLDGLKEEGDALAPADASGTNGTLQLLPLHLVDQVARDAGTRCRQWVTQGDGSSVHIQLIHVQFQGLGTGQGLHAEGFVDLKKERETELSNPRGQEIPPED